MLAGRGGGTKSTPDKDGAMPAITPPGKVSDGNSKNTTDKDDAMTTIAPPGKGGDDNSKNTTDKDGATSAASPFPPPPFTCKVLNFGPLYETDCFTTDCCDCFYAMATYGNTTAIYRMDEEPPGMNLLSEEDGKKSFTSRIGITTDYWIATIAMSDDVIVAGDPYGGDEWTGIVHVYEKDFSGKWNETIQIIPPNIDELASFGYSVSTDGDLFVVGAPHDSGSTGSAFIYQRTETGGWAQVAKLTPEGPGNIKKFGHAVAMKGNMIAVADNLNGSDEKGSVFVYQYGTSSDSTQWRLSDIIVNDNCVGYFGTSLEITDDDNLVIGCPLDDDNTGAVYYYKQVDGDDSFSFRQKITPQEEGGVDVTQFGGFVTVGGNYMAVGTVEETNGKVYIFVLDEDDYWKRVARIDAVDASSSNDRFFGYGIELSGNDILVAHGDNIYSYKILCGESDTLSLIYP